jgi:hypothetical protein
MDDEQSVSDVELIVADLNGPHAFGIATDDGHRYVVVDNRFRRNDPRARASAFNAYLRLTGPATATA